MAPSKRFRILISTKAVRQMERHVFYLAKINPPAAKKLKQTMMTDIKSIAHMPEKCLLYDRPWLIPGKYRYKLSADRYRIVFVIQEDTVWIDGVMDCYEDDAYRKP